MQLDQNDDADRRGSQGSDLGGFNSMSHWQPSSRLRDKLQKLAKWRIDSSSIEFPKDGPKFCGGFATVSQGFLTSTSASKSIADVSAQTGGQNEPDSGTPKRKAIAVNKLKLENGKDKWRLLVLALRQAGFLDKLPQETAIKVEKFSEDMRKDEFKDKLLELLGWRNDSASIGFPNDVRVFRGGYATVAGSALVSTSGTEKRADNLARTRGKDKSDDGNTRRETVAVKKLKIENKNEEDKERILGLALREAGFLTELSHENIVRLEGFVEDMSEDRVWLVFPWADNGNLKDFVASDEWEIPERISLMNDVTKGVEYLHTRDPPIYHGDLKSINILVNKQYRAIITDFGSARRLAKRDTDARAETPKKEPQPALMLKATFCEASNTITLKSNKYTLRWAAPELLIDEGPGPWSDIWSLGWIFFEVITNHIPFQDVQRDFVVIARITQGKLPSIADHDRVTLIRELHSLMVECWSIDPSKRPKAEDCRKSMAWMPMTIPEPHQTSNSSASRARSPDLLLQLARMYAKQDDLENGVKYLVDSQLNQARQLVDAPPDHAPDLSASTPQYFHPTSDLGTMVDYGFRTVADLMNRSQKAFSVLGPSDDHRLDGDDLKRLSELTKDDPAQDMTSAELLLVLASSYLALNEHSKAAAVYSKATQIFAESNNEKGRADALLGLADAHRLQNEYGKAVKSYSKAIQLYAEMGNRKGRADVLWGLAEIDRLQKQYTQASKGFSEALQIFTDIGERQGRAITLLCLAEIHRHQDQRNEAVPFYEQAAELFKKVGSPEVAARVLNLATSSRQKLGPAGPTSMEELRRRRLARFGGQ